MWSNVLLLPCPPPSSSHHICGDRRGGRANDVSIQADSRRALRSSSLPSLPPSHHMKLLSCSLHASPNLARCHRLRHARTETPLRKEGRKEGRKGGREERAVEKEPLPSSSGQTPLRRTETDRGGQTAATRPAAAVTGGGKNHPLGRSRVRTCYPLSPPTVMLRARLDLAASWWLVELQSGAMQCKQTGL